MPGKPHSRSGPSRGQGTDLVSLSARLMESRGLRLLGPLCGATVGGVRLHLTAIDPSNLRLVVAAVTTPRGRFGTLVGLLRCRVVGQLCRRGLIVEVHAWGRSGMAHVCEVLGVGPADFEPKGSAVGPAPR